MRALFEIIHAAFHDTSTRIHRIVEGTIWALILFATGIVAIELSGQIKDVAALELADRIILWIFAAELLLRVLSYRPPVLEITRLKRRRLRLHITGRLRYALRPMLLIDLLTVLSLIGPLRMLRALRLLRLLRTARVFRYASPLLSLLRTLQENALLFYSAMSLMLLTILAGGLTIYLSEAGTNPSIKTVGDGIWWALVTITTVGYGDVTPVTVTGRIIGGAMMLAGMFTLALFAGIVGSTLLNVVLKLRQEQFRMSNRANHVVVCGHDAGSRLLLDALLDEFPDGSDTDILIFHRGERPPDLPPEFSWIPGDPTKESELAKARVQYASTVVVVGSREVTPQHADASTILVVFTLRSYLQKHAVTKDRLQPVYIIAEILDAENVGHARAAGADEVIESTRLGFSLLAHSVLVQGAGEIMASVALAGSHNIYVGKSPFELMNYGEVSRKVKEQYDATVIGLRDMETGEAEIGPGDATTVDKGAALIYLAKAAVLESAR